MKHDPLFGGGGGRGGLGVEDGQVHSLAQFVSAGRAFLLNGCMTVCMILS